jgi:hypothetical protein
LIDHNEYIKALEMAQTFYEGKLLYAVTNIPENQEEREKTIGNFIESMISKYISHLNATFNSVRSDLEQISNLLFSTAIKIRKTDLIFTQIHQLFSEFEVLKIYVSIYNIDLQYDSLESSILNGDLKSIPFPSIIRDFQDHLISQQHYSRLENILCMLDLKVLNTDSVLLLCTKHHLFKAMIRIYNICLNEYITPIKEIIKLIRSSKTTDFSLAAGVEILFEYLESCLKISVDGVQAACIQFLFSAIDDSILQTLADFNLTKLLRICEICLDLPLATWKIPITSNLILDRSFIVQSLLNLASTSTSEAEINIFASKMIVKHSLPWSTESIHSLIRKLSYSKVNSDTSCSTQDSIISLLHCFSDVTGDVEEFRKRGFWKVVEFLGRKNHKYDLVMEGMIRNPFGRDTLLDDLDHLFSSASIPDFPTIKSVLYRELETLVSLKIGICNLVSDFHLDHNFCLGLLLPSSQLLYLSELFSDSNFSDLELYDKYLLLVCEFNPRHLKSQILQSSHSFTGKSLLAHCRQYKILDAYLYLETDPFKCLEFLKDSISACLEYLGPVMEFCKKHSQTLDLKDFYSSLFTNLESYDESLDLILSSLPLTSVLSLIKVFKKPILHKIQTHQTSQIILNSTLIRVLQEETIVDFDSLLKSKRRATLHF